MITESICTDGPSAIVLFESKRDLSTANQQFENNLKLEIDTPLQRDNGIDVHRHDGPSANVLFDSKRDLSTANQQFENNLKLEIDTPLQRDNGID